MESRWLAPSIAAAWLVLPLTAAGHETTSEVSRDRAAAVRARTHDGEGMANTEAEVFSPADPSTPFWKGRTDRNGWVAFVPDAPGPWRVRVVDATGHGVTATVHVPAPGSSGAVESAPLPPPQKAFSIGPVVSVALIAAIFGLLYAWGRRRGR
jgi:nickel transport protein